jgi:inorganic triphosphatase YgiF
LVSGVNGSLIEQSPDIGHIVAGPKSTPVSVLELELMAGQLAALFELAYQISRTVSVMSPDLQTLGLGTACAVTQAL